MYISASSPYINSSLTPVGRWARSSHSAISGQESWPSWSERVLGGSFPLTFSSLPDMWETSQLPRSVDFNAFTICTVFLVVLHYQIYVQFLCMVRYTSLHGSCRYSATYLTHAIFALKGYLYRYTDLLSLQMRAFFIYAECEQVKVYARCKLYTWHQSNHDVSNRGW